MLSRSAGAVDPAQQKWDRKVSRMMKRREPRKLLCMRVYGLGLRLSVAGFWA